MPIFESILNAPGLTFGAGATPEASRPGAHPESFEDFRHEPNLRNSLSGTSSEDVYAQWLDHAKFVAERARLYAEAGEKSATALARLSHAYLSADEPQLAASAAAEALDIVIGQQALLSRDGQAPSPDIPAAVAAAWALVLSGQKSLAKSRLSQLPPSLPVALIRATIAADSGELTDAIHLLADVESPEVDCLRGYVLLRLNRPQDAVHELRKAISAGKSNADACATMAAAFWRLGSRRKAINFARQASRLAPGRKDISLALIDYLTNSFELLAAEVEIESVLNSGVEDEPELILRRARIRALRGDTDKCIALLRRTRSMANASADLKLSSFVMGQLVLMEHMVDNIDLAEALRRIRSLMGKFPHDMSLAIAFSTLCVRSTMLRELRSVYDAHKGSSSDAELRPMIMRIAYLEGRYEELARMAAEWSRAEPLNSHAADLALVWQAYVTLDWAAAAHAGLSLLQRFPYDASMANNVAYFSVLAGRPGLAEKALSGVESEAIGKRYVLLATRGLVEIAKGHIQDGLRNYRRAAELAERDPDGQVGRAEVIVAQGLALRLIGAYDEVSSALRASALPSVSLPANWPDVPGLRTMQWICERSGCVWPPFVA